MSLGAYGADLKTTDRRMGRRLDHAKESHGNKRGRLAQAAKLKRASRQDLCPALERPVVPDQSNLRLTIQELRDGFVQGLEKNPNLDLFSPQHAERLGEMGHEYAQLPVDGERWARHKELCGGAHRHGEAGGSELRGDRQVQECLPARGSCSDEWCVCACAVRMCA